MNNIDSKFISDIHKEAWKLQNLKGPIDYSKKFNEEGIMIPDFELNTKSFEELLYNKDYNFTPLTIKNYVSRYNRLQAYNILQNLHDSKKTMKLICAWYNTLHSIKTILGFVCSYIKILPINYRKQVTDLDSYTNLMLYLTAIQHYISNKEYYNMSVNESKNWVKLHILNQIVEHTKEIKDYYNYIMFYLFLKVCPLRTDLKTVKIKNYDITKDNFIDISNNVIIFNKIFKQKNKKLTFLFPEHLKHELESYLKTRRDKESDYLFPIKRDFSKQFNKNMNFYYHLLYPNTPKNLTIQLIRKVIASETQTNNPAELYELARNMGHSLKIHKEVYTKPIN